MVKTELPKLLQMLKRTKIEVHLHGYELLKWKDDNWSLSRGAYVFVIIGRLLLFGAISAVIVIIKPWTVGIVIKNPEIASLVPTLLLGLTDPNGHSKYSLDILLQTTCVNSVDAPSLALLVPIVHRGLRERSSETKKKAAQIARNMCSSVTDPNDMLPYIGLLLPEMKKVLVDRIPEIRSVAARTVGSLIRGMGGEFPRSCFMVAIYTQV